MLLLTDLTGARDESIGIKYCQKIREISIADTHINTAYKTYHRYLPQYSKLLSILLVAIPIQRY